MASAPGLRREHVEKEPGPDGDRPASRYQMRQRRHRIADDAFRHAVNLNLSELQIIFSFNPQSGGCFGPRFFQERGLVFAANSKVDM
jgi:hypothetical protein